jgi:SAM-dependent methyltransferase
MKANPSRQGRVESRVALRPPPGATSLPSFQLGWRSSGGGIDPYLSYVPDGHEVNWSADLERLHADASRDHFIDVWTRQSMLAGLDDLPASPVILDLGCSSGYMLEDLQTAHPDALLVGVDLIGSGLCTAHTHVPAARLLQADACSLPIEDATADGAVSANLLEHVPDDLAALVELRRVLRPRARAALVVPYGPTTYDYYDRFLGHQRRYARGELARKSMAAGLEVIGDTYLGSFLYPAFWLVKKRNRRRHGGLHGEALESRVADDIMRTRESRLAQMLSALERRVPLKLPFGIRELVVVRRPDDD